MAGVIFDSGALIAIDRDERPIWNLVRQTIHEGVVVSVPAPALAQVWRGSSSARLAQMLRDCDIVALDEALAKQVGELLAISETTDITDAAVVVTAARAGATIITSDPRDMRRLSSHTSGVVVLDIRKLPGTIK